MSDQLADTEVAQHESFERYLHSLDPLEISRILHETSDTALDRAYKALCALCAALENLPDDLALIMELLQQSWGGPSADTIINELQDYEEWWYDTIKSAETTKKCLRTARYARTLAVMNSPPPAEISANRAQAERSKTTDTLGTTTIQLDNDYLLMWTRSLTAMQEYHTKVTRAVEDLPTFIPLGAQQGFIGAKKAKRAAP